MRDKCLNVKLFVAGLILAGFISCKSPKDKVMSNIRGALSTHFDAEHKRSGSTGTIDSFSIIKIDSISSREDLVARINSLRESLDDLTMRSELADKLRKLREATSNNLQNGQAVSNDAASKQRADVTAGSIKVLQEQMDSLKTIYLSNKTDSTDFLYYAVLYRLCYSYKKTLHDCKDSLYLLVTKDFKVKKR